MKKCRTRDEFFELTRDWYGVGLTFSGSIYYPRYEIDQKERWYSKLEGPRARDKEFSQYDGLKVILASTFGEIYCGGVAGSHYGQYKVVGYRNKKRLEKLYQTVLSPQYQEVVSNYPIEARG